jgi:hypothetical protein
LVAHKRVLDHEVEEGVGAAEAADGEAEEADGDGDGVVEIAEAGITKWPNHPLQQPMTNKQGRRGKGLSSPTAPQILECGGRLSPLSKARRRSKRTGTTQHRNDA